METQRFLDKPALSWPNPVFGDLDLEKSDLTGFPPGEYIEEAAQLPAICRAEPLEDLRCPGRSADLSDCPERRGWEPLGA